MEHGTSGRGTSWRAGVKCVCSEVGITSLKLMALDKPENTNERRLKTSEYQSVNVN